MDYRAIRRLVEADRRDGTNRFAEEFIDSIHDGHVEPNVVSPRRLFEALVPDAHEMVDTWNPRYEAEGRVSIFEADPVATATFSSITKELVYEELKAGYDMPEFVFKNAIPERQARFIDGDKLPGFTGVGDEAETIDEGKPYPYVGAAEDWIFTAPTTKRGMIMALTREAIWQDNSGGLLMEARRLGEWLGLNREKRAIDCMIDENTTTHRYRKRNQSAIATYGNNSGSHDFDNLAASTGLVDWTDVEAVNVLWGDGSIADPDTAEPIAVTLTHLWCAKSLELTALRIINATEIRVATPGFATTGNPTQTTVANPYRGVYQVLASNLVAGRLATDTDWFLGNPSRAFAYSVVFPLSTVEAPMNNHDEFTRDIAFQYKAGERGAYTTLEPRYVAKATA